MQHCVCSLTEIVRDRIINEGPVSFRDFMEMALYYPGLGYYTSATEKIGKRGDYYTSPCYTNVFGRMIARQIEEMWKLLGEEEFTIVEYGAGNGALCYDILNELKENSELYQHLRYCIIERSAVMREREHLAVNEKVSWHDSIHEVKGFTGCVISNELLDNFAVHKVVMQRELMEVFVDYDNGFKETLQPAGDELKQYLLQLGVELPPGFITEINLDALSWQHEIAGAISKGFVITIDYGYPSDELYCMRRRNGTLVCYAGHKVYDNPYERIGRQDITAHVNFSALCHWGRQNGLLYCGYASQARFLQSLGISAYIREQEEKGRIISPGNSASFAHTLMTDMGNKFKVLIQQKGLERPALSGMCFAQMAI